MKIGLSPLVALALLVAPSFAWAQSEPEASDAPPAQLPPAAPPAPPAAPAQVQVPPLGPVAAPPPVASPASASAPAPAFYAPRESELRPHVPPRYDYLRVGLGFRIGFIDDRAFDTFANDDVLPQMSLDASYAFFTKGKLAISGGLAWDVGSRTSGARGLTTRLTVHRLTVPIEARWYFAPWFGVFGKVAPGVGAYYARVEDPSSPATLEHAPWVLAGDLSAGATFRVLGTNDHDTRSVRLWITPEIGYGITSSHALRPRPNRDESDVLGADERTNLGSLAVNGFFWRTSLGLTF